MLQKSTNICEKLANNGLKTAIFMAIFAGIITFCIEYIFARALNVNLPLSLLTAVFSFFAVFILHYVIFKIFRRLSWRCITLLVFPVFYMGGLITTFGIATTLLSFTWFQVPLINQIYLQGWAFLAQAFIYAAFSPKSAIFITCIVIWFSFFCALKNHNIQAKQD